MKYASEIGCKILADNMYVMRTLGHRGPGEGFVGDSALRVIVRGMGLWGNRGILDMVAILVGRIEITHHILFDICIYELSKKKLVITR